MFQLPLVYILHADREREIEAAIRRHRLLKPQDSATEPDQTALRHAPAGRTLSVRIRPSRG